MIYSIVVTYNGAQWIDKCLSSLENSSIVDHHIIVIDNGSTDDTIAIVKQNYPEVELLEQNENLGFGKANNIGMKMALDEGADNVFLLNQDAWVDEDTIFKLVDAHKSNSQYGVISPMHLNGEGNLIDYKVYSNISKRKNGREIFSNGFSKSSTEILEIDFVNAAAWLVTKECIEKVGFFDKLFFHYGEDNNYAQRVRFHGFKFGIQADVIAYHDRERFCSNKMTVSKYKIQTKALMFNILCDINSKNLLVSFLRFFVYFISSFIKNMWQGLLRFGLIDLSYVFTSPLRIFKIKKALAFYKNTYSQQ